jgi:hypothetical protein
MQDSNQKNGIVPACRLPFTESSFGKSKPTHRGQLEERGKEEIRLRLPCCVPVLPKYGFRRPACLSFACVHVILLEQQDQPARCNQENYACLPVCALPREIAPVRKIRQAGERRSALFFCALAKRIKNGGAAD